MLNLSWSDVASRSRYVLGHTVVRNAASLFAVRMTISVTALATLPYLGRVLGPVAFGVYILAESLNGVLLTLFDYGFGLSITRAIARCRDKPEEMARIVAGVYGAKLLLLLAGLLLAIAALFVWPTFMQFWPFWLAAVLSAVISTTIPWWFFQGIEDLRLPAGLSISMRLVATAAVFVFIRSPSDGWMVAGLVGLTSLPMSVLTLRRMYQTVPWQRPSWSLSASVLCEGWPLFLDQASRVLYSTVNPLVLGFFAAPAIVGFYGAGEKVIRIVRQLIEGASTALYPRMSNVVLADHAKAFRIKKRLLLGATVSGVALAIGLVALGPIIVPILMGAEYGASVPVLRILAVAVPLSALATVFGAQWLLPHGRDRAFASATISAGLVNLVLGSTLAYFYGAVGMAAAVVAVEALVLTMLWAFSRRVGIEVHSAEMRSGEGSRKESAEPSAPAAGAFPPK